LVVVGLRYTYSTIHPSAKIPSVQQIHEFSRARYCDQVICGNYHDPHVLCGSASAEAMGK
jgi:hypothetical protein